MPKLKDNKVPKYRLHKQSGQAVVTLNGRDICLGKHDTPASREKYNRLIAEWMTNGRRLATPAAAFNVSNLILRFWRHAEAHYRDADGNPTSELKNFSDVLKILRGLYGSTLAAKFGPLSLKTIRNEMIKLGWVRTSINRQINRIRHVFKWAVENEHIPPAVHQGLAAVKGLQVGRSEAKESDPVEAVAEAFVDSVVEHLSSHIGSMVRLQVLTGMRSGEVCGMRGCDVETNGKIWVYRPPRHKNAHRGHKRVIHLGPQAQKVLETFLKPDTQAYLFSPADAERERREKQREAREADGTPLNCGNRPGSNVAEEPKKSPGLKYGVVAYCKAVYAGCDKAFPLPDDLARGRVKSDKGKERTRWETPAEWRKRLGERWSEAAKWIADHRFHPHQLRHSAATKLRKEYGLEAARVVLGHKSLAITETYAEIDQGKAREIMGKVG